MKTRESELIIISIMCSLFVGILFLSDISTYKTIGAGLFLTTVPAYFFPLTFSINNMFVEMWNKKIALILVMACIVIELFLDGALSLIALHTNSLHKHYSESFSFALGKTWFAGLGVFIGMVLGFFTNTIVLSFLKDRFGYYTFPVRAIVSTFFGEIVFTLIAFKLWFIGDSLSNPFHMAIVSIVLKMIFISALSYPCYLLSCFLIKKSVFRGSVKIDSIVKFNPLRGKTVYRFTYAGSRASFDATAKDLKARSYFSLTDEDRILIRSDLNGSIVSEIDNQKARFIK